MIRVDSKRKVEYTRKKSSFAFYDSVAMQDPSLSFLKHSNLVPYLFFIAKFLG